MPQKHINRHIAVRSSQLILLFLAIEAFLLFDILPPEPGSLFYGWGCLECGFCWKRWLFGAALGVALGFAVWQYVLVNDLDRNLARTIEEEEEEEQVEDEDENTEEDDPEP